MSELINNREERRRILKTIIMDLHAGRDPGELRAEFKSLLDQVGPEEIMALEQSLVDDGLEVEQITKLCDVHVSVFRDSLEQQAHDIKPTTGHPIDAFAAESKAITALLDTLGPVVEEIKAKEAGEPIDELLERWQMGHAELTGVDEHYSRKENLLFPYLERHGVSGPSSVMWSIHDEIRAGVKRISMMLMHLNPTATPELAAAIKNQVLPVYDQIGEMVFKEEHILYPTCRDVFTDAEWAIIAAEASSEMDITPPRTEPEAAPEWMNEGLSGDEQRVRFETGVLTPAEIEGIFNHLPVDITFVGKDDTVRYFSNSQERIFTRTKAVIGRKVQNCHPPGSMHVVERILNDFKSGARDHADFWIQMKGMFVYIRYFAVRSAEGEYMGTLEVSQNVQPIRELEGEQRILDDLPVS